MSAVPSTASAYFGQMVESYDSLIRRAVPRYDEMTDRLVDHLPAHTPRILELGCGTGNLTLRLAERYPGATITTVDASPEMTAVTASRVPARTPALVAITVRFEDLSFAPASFDLIASCMSLHHVRDKGALYRSIASWLAPGGWFAIADQMLGATPEIQARHWDLWLRFCREPGHCSKDEIRSLTNHAAQHDHYTPLADHFAMLGTIGFGTLDCIWRNGMYTVIVAGR